MIKGINLTLMIGPAIPLPAPKVVVDSLMSVQVNNGGERGGFQLTFAVSKTSPLLTTMLPAGYFDPMITRVIIIVTLKGFPNVLMDGIVTRQEMTPSNEPGQSTLTITGEDLSVLMDVVEVKRPFPSMGETAKLYTVLAPYARFGVIPLVIPSLFGETLMSPIDGFGMQTTTDLDFIKTLANQNGYVFYIEPGPVPKRSIAYFGPNIRIPIPQPALNVNMDAHTNVESLSFSLNGLAKEMLVVVIYDPITHKIPIPIPIPNVSAFQPPLGLRPTPPAKLKFMKTGDKDFTEVLNAAVGQMLRGNDNAITGSGTLDVLRYGRVLRARMLVGVRGAGRAYDGLYYVDTVTHNIKRGEYKQSFSLSRDGLISITPRVPT